MGADYHARGFALGRDKTRRIGRTDPDDGVASVGRDGAFALPASFALRGAAAADRRINGPSGARCLTRTSAYNKSHLQFAVGLCAATRLWRRTYARQRQPDPTESIGCAGQRPMATCLIPTDRCAADGPSVGAMRFANHCYHHPLHRPIAHNAT
jgi:hypothetical protein